LQGEGTILRRSAELQSFGDECSSLLKRHASGCQHVLAWVVSRRGDRRSDEGRRDEPCKGDPWREPVTLGIAAQHDERESDMRGFARW
jgi:hypothetical protein